MILWKWWSVTSQARSLKLLWLLSCSFESLSLRGASPHFEQPSGETRMERNWGLLSTASTNLPAMWVSQLRSRSSSLRQAFRWLQPESLFWLQAHERPQAWIIHLRCSWHWPPKLCDVKNIYYCLKLLSFGVICYVAINIIEAILGANLRALFIFVSLVNLT